MKANNKLNKLIFSPLYFVGVSTIALFLANGIFNLLLPGFEAGLLKAFLITLLVSPIFFIFIYIPLIKYLEERKVFEDNLININTQLQRNLYDWSQELNDIKKIAIKTKRNRAAND